MDRAAPCLGRRHSRGRYAAPGDAGFPPWQAAFAHPRMRVSAAWRPRRSGAQFGQALADAQLQAARHRLVEARARQAFGQVVSRRRRSHRPRRAHSGSPAPWPSCFISRVGALRRCSRHRPRAVAAHQFARGVPGGVDRIRLRRHRQVHRGLGQRQLAFGRAQPLVDLGRIQRPGAARAGRPGRCPRWPCAAAAAPRSAGRRRRRACAPASTAWHPGRSRAPTCAAPRWCRRTGRRSCRSGAAARPAPARASGSSICVSAASRAARPATFS